MFVSGWDIDTATYSTAWLFNNLNDGTRLLTLCLFFLLGNFVFLRLPTSLLRELTIRYLYYHQATLKLVRSTRLLLQIEASKLYSSCSKFQLLYGILMKSIFKPLVIYSNEQILLKLTIKKIYMDRR